MTEHDRCLVRPIVLAGGLGTRLRPRTLHLPKPLLPVCGRPLLWYVLSSLRDQPVLEPIVTLDYKAELITAFFANAPAAFRTLPGRTMAEAFLEVAQADGADAFLGMSSDVLMSGTAVSESLASYRRAGGQDTALFVRLPTPGHKKWEFIVQDDRLRDIRIQECNSLFERLVLILSATTVHTLCKALARPVTEETLPAALRPYQSGWTLLLKVMLDCNIPVYARFVDLSVQNINCPQDFSAAEAFVREHLRDAT